MFIHPEIKVVQPVYLVLFTLHFTSNFTLLGYFWSENVTSNKHAPFGKFHAQGYQLSWIERERGSAAFSFLTPIPHQNLTALLSIIQNLLHHKCVPKCTSTLKSRLKTHFFFFQFLFIFAYQVFFFFFFFFFFASQNLKSWGCKCCIANFGFSCQAYTQTIFTSHILEEIYPPAPWIYTSLYDCAHLYQNLWQNAWHSWIDLKGGNPCTPPLSFAETGVRPSPPWFCRNKAPECGHPSATAFRKLCLHPYWKFLDPPWCSYKSMPNVAVQAVASQM